MTERDIDELAMKTLDAHVRAASAGLTIAQINSDRDVFASEAKRKAGEDLKSTGLEIPAFVVKDLEEHLDELIGSSGEVVRPVGPGSRGLVRIPWRWEMRYLAVSEGEIGVGERVVVTGVQGQGVIVTRAST